VEHSTDGEHFSMIGTVNENDNTSGKYSFTDHNPASGKNFYRLKQTPLSGNSIYSVVVMVSTVPAETKLDVFPNPASQQFTLRFSGISDKIWTITIADLAGNIVYTNAMQSLYNLIQVKTNKILPPSLYIIKLRSNDRTLFGKLLIK
jgi:hypothetical protein